MSSRTQFIKLGGLGQGAQRAAARVTKELGGERLDRALAALVPELSRRRAQKAISMGGVYVGQERVRVASRPVRPGDALTATWHPDVTAPERFELEIVYEDDDIAVVNKPPGQMSQGSELGDVGTLSWALGHRFGPRVRLMHRLDKPASGLLVAALHQDASGGLTPQFRDHSLDRVYLAVTAGIPAEGLCDKPLIKDGRRMRVAEPEEDGLPARSTVRVIDTFTDGETNRALVAVSIATGRTHQIRVHLASLGTPIIGDRSYGPKGQKGKAGRLCLHAARLGFKHPLRQGQVVRMTAPDDGFWEAAGIDAVDVIEALSAPERPKVEATGTSEAKA